MKPPKAPNKSEKTPGKGKPATAAYRLTGMGIKMGVVIYLGIYGGQKIDERTPWETPWFTLLGALLGVGMALYFAISDLRQL